MKNNYSLYYNFQRLLIIKTNQRNGLTNLEVVLNPEGPARLGKRSLHIDFLASYIWDSLRQNTLVNRAE